MDQLIQLMNEAILFSDLSTDEKYGILSHSRLLDIPKKNYLIHFQDICDFFGIIVKGKINLIQIYENGNHGTMDVLEEYDLFGVDLICTHRRISPYYAVAAQHTQVLIFPASLVMEPGILREDVRQSLLLKILKYVAEENLRKVYRLAIIYQNGLRDRIMTYLTTEADRYHSDSFTIPYTREEMASYLFVNRTCLSHELSLMEQEGLIKFHRNHFTLLNRNKKHDDHEQNADVV